MEDSKKKSKKNSNKALDAPKKLKILVSIVNRNKTDFYVSALEGFDVNMQQVIYATGTAPTELLDMLGVTDNKKSVILSVVQEDKIKEILAAYEDRYFKTRNGKGVAFTIPINSMIGVLVYKFLSNSTEGMGE